jgi:hypothetical protein
MSVAVPVPRPRPDGHVAVTGAHRTRLWQEEPARRGEGDALTAAFEQLGTELLLQCLDLL